MSRPPFYYSTMKKLIVAFVSIFDGLRIEDDFGREITVPIVFAQKEKFIDDLSANFSYDMDSLVYDTVLPKMGFEIAGMNYAPERALNIMQTMKSITEDGQEIIGYNRVPYDISFDLFIGCRKLEDGLKVFEQIIPYFSPELTLTIKDREDFGNQTNISFVLNSTALNIDYAGSMDTKRTILFTLNFTAKAYFYPDVRENNTIRQTIVDFTDMNNINQTFARITSTVDPITANKDDPHQIIDVIEEGITND